MLGKGGDKGKTGEKGMKGPQGSPGPAGKDGAPGKTGDCGGKGPKGDNWNNGDATLTRFPSKVTEGSKVITKDPTSTKPAVVAPPPKPM